MRGPTYKLVLVLSSITVICITLIAFVGYYFNNPYLYGWSGGSGMAKNSGICFILISIALFMIGSKKSNN